MIQVHHQSQGDYNSSTFYENRLVSRHKTGVGSIARHKIWRDNLQTNQPPHKHQLIYVPRHYMRDTK